MNEKKARKFIDFLIIEDTGCEPPPKDDKGFCEFLIHWFGGRTYNNYLSYDALAYKLIKYIRRLPLKVNPDHLMELVEHLYWDDKHDLWQNAPIILENFFKESPELEDSFYSFFKEAIIESLYHNGEFVDSLRRDVR